MTCSPLRFSFPVFLVTALGCAGSTAAAGTEGAVSASAHAAVEAPVTVAPEITVAPEVAVDVNVHLDARGGDASERGSGAAGSGAASGAVVVLEEAVAETCPGLSIHSAGETRRGRALGASILQVYAQPDAELFVDGRRQGETPLIAVGVDAGPRDVRLRNVPLGYDCTVRLRALPGERYSVLLDLQ